MRYFEDDKRVFDDYNTASRLISIYWSEVENLNYLTKFDSEEEVIDELDDLLRDKHPSKKEGTLINWRTSIKNFVWEMEVGDFILTPAPPEDNRCFLGIIQSGYFFANNNHHRKVEWIAILSRGIIEEKLNKSLGTPSSVTSLNKYSKEIGELIIKFG